MNITHRKTLKSGKLFVHKFVLDEDTGLITNEHGEQDQLAPLILSEVNTLREGKKMEWTTNAGVHHEIIPAFRCRCCGEEVLQWEDLGDGWDRCPSCGSN